MQSLSPEVARSDRDIRAVYQVGMFRVVEQVAKGLQEGSLAERRKRAWAFLSILSGGVTIARAVEDGDVAAQIARSIKASALATIAGK